MALSATCDLEIRSTGSDNNGGGFNTASGGSDWSQQDAAQVFIDGATITAAVQATTTDILIVGYTVLAGDVGNFIQITGGTATAGFYQIVSVNTGTNIWTLDRSAGTAAQTVVGRMGGGLATIGKAGSVPIVAGNRIWIKYHASNVYSSTSTTVNVANGRLGISAGSVTAPVLVRGYETTHGDATGNRPILRWGANAASNYLVTLNNANNFIENVIFDGNRANFTSTRGLSMVNGYEGVYGCKFTSFNNGAVVYNSGTSPAYITNCEFTDCVTTAVVTVSNTAFLTLYGCNFHDNTVTALLNTSTGFMQVIRTIFDTNTGGSSCGIQLTSTSRLMVYEPTFYNQGQHGIDVQNASSSLELINPIFESNGGWGVNTNAAGPYAEIRIFVAAFYNNTSGTYDTSKVLAQNVFGIITQSAGTFFVDAPNQNFQPNNTAGQGALIRALALPTTFPGGTANYQDVGAMQHQDSGGGGLALPVTRII